MVDEKASGSVAWKVDLMDKLTVAQKVVLKGISKAAQTAVWSAEKWVALSDEKRVEMLG